MSSDETARIYLFDTAGRQIFTQTDSALSTGTHHIVFTYDGSEHPNGMTIYVDGFSVAVTGTDDGAYTNMEDTAAPLIIGARDGFAGDPDYFESWLDDVRIYDKELSATEVLFLYNDGQGTEWEGYKEGDIGARVSY